MRHDRAPIESSPLEAARTKRRMGRWMTTSWSPRCSARRYSRWRPRACPPVKKWRH